MLYVVRMKLQEAQNKCSKRLKDEHSVQNPNKDAKPPVLGPIAKDTLLSGLLSRKLTMLHIRRV